MTISQRKPQTQQDDFQVNEPGVELTCDSCQCDLTHTIRIKCADTADDGSGVDICPACFCAGKEFANHKRGHPYRVIEFNSYPIFDEDWSADEELLLLRALSSQGIGNWKKIADQVGTRTKAEVEEHYKKTYIEPPTYPLPNTKRSFDIDSEEFQSRKRRRIQQMQAAPPPPHKIAPVSAPGVHEISGFLPGRLEFEHEQENDAEDLVKDLEFGMVMAYGGDGSDFAQFAGHRVFGFPKPNSSIDDAGDSPMHVVEDEDDADVKAWKKFEEDKKHGVPPMLPGTLKRKRAPTTSPTVATTNGHAFPLSLQMNGLSPTISTNGLHKPISAGPVTKAPALPPKPPPPAVGGKGIFNPSLGGYVSRPGTNPSTPVQQDNNPLSQIVIPPAESTAKPRSAAPNSATSPAGEDDEDPDEPMPPPPVETAQSLEFKLTLLRIYLDRIEKRREAKQLIFERGLVEHKKTQQQEKKKLPLKEEREIVHRLKPFAKLMNPVSYEDFSGDILYEAQLRKRIQELQGFRRLGLQTVAEISNYEKELFTRQQKAREYYPAVRGSSARQSSIAADPKRGSLEPSDREGTPRISTSGPSSTRKKSTGPLSLAESPSLHLLTPAEVALCASLHIMPKPYLSVKETLVREYARRGGKLRRREARDLVKIDVNKTSRVWDFLVQAGYLKISDLSAVGVGGTGAGAGTTGVGGGGTTTTTTGGAGLGLPTAATVSSTVNGSTSTPVPTPASATPTQQQQYSARPLQPPLASTAPNSMKPIATIPPASSPRPPPLPHMAQNQSNGSTASNTPTLPNTNMLPAMPMTSPSMPGSFTTPSPDKAMMGLPVGAGKPGITSPVPNSNLNSNLGSTSPVKAQFGSQSSSSSTLESSSLSGGSQRSGG